MLEKVIEKVRALNEPNPCRLEAKYKPHTHTSDEVFMGDVGEWEGESLTDTLGAIVVMIEGKADVNHGHDIDEIEGLQVALNHKANINHGHDEISSPEGEARVYFEDGDVRISGKDLVIDLSDSEGEDIVRITESDLINIARAKRNPDETPTTNSDNLVTSGGVAAALAGKAASSHTQAISTITGLQTALDKKVEFGVEKVNANSSPLVITNVPEGKPYLVYASTAKPVSDMVSSIYDIKFSGDTTTRRCYLIRVYSGGLAFSSTCRLVVVDGAWS